MAKKPTRPTVALPEAKAIHEIAERALNNFGVGHAGELESALGMLYMGHAFGWKVLYIIHSASTVRKYERILDIVAKDFFPAETEHSDRSYAYVAVKKVSNFWKAIRGEVEADGIRDKSIGPA